MKSRYLRLSVRPGLAMLALAAMAIWWWRRDIAEAVPGLWWLDAEPYTATAIIMQSEARVCIVPGFGMAAGKREAAQRAFAAMRQVERLMSKFDPASDVGRLNRQPPGAWLEVNPLTWQAVMAALRLHRLTDGAFDITVEPLLRLYAFGQREVASLPLPEEIAAARARVGSYQILYEREGMRLALAREGMAIDLGGLAPGLAVDRAIEELDRCGVRNALVELGGEVRLMGKSRAALGNSALLAPLSETTSRDWRIAIRHPRRADEKIAVLAASDCAIATSGDYEKYFICQGRRYAHIIDPRTGYPAAAAVASVTVIHPRSCLMADALATAFCVLGPEGTSQWLQDIGDDMPEVAGMEAIFFVIQPDGSLKRVEVKSQPPAP